jgi:hypothetical protein
MGAVGGMAPERDVELVREVGDRDVPFITRRVRIFGAAE